MTSFTDFSCPACGSPSQRFPVFLSLCRSVKRACSRCGVEIESTLSARKYLALLVYQQAMVVLVGFPFVLALAGGRLGLATASAAVFVALVWLPAMMLHARHATVNQGKHF